MEQELNRQVLSVQKELNFLKSSLDPVFLFLQEIQELKKKRNISQNNSITSSALLLLDIKEDILKDVTKLQISTEEKLTEIQQEVKHEIKQIQDSNTEAFNKFNDDLYGISLNSKDILTSLNTVKNTTGENTLYIKEFRKELDTRATMHNIEELRYLIKNMTPLANHENLKSRVSECSSIYQYQTLQKKAQKLKLGLKNCIKTEELDRKFKEFTMILFKDFSQSYTTMASFEAHQIKTEKLLSESNDHYYGLRDYINKLDNSNNEKIRLIKKALESRPWKTELNTIYDEINGKVTRAELDEILKDINESVKNFYKDMIRFKIQVEHFEKVIERFDEILLDKAQKDETKKINLTIAGLATIESVENIKKIMYQFTQSSEDKFQAQCAIVDKIVMNFENISEKFEILKKDNFDVSNLSASVYEFKQTLERKANKQDIYEIYDNMCKRVDFVEALESLKTLKKQVEQGIGLVFSLCRTLLETGEPAAQIKRQRYELFKNLNTLVNWIINESNPCYNTMSVSRNAEMPEIEDLTESRFPSRHSVYLRRRSAVTAKETKRLHIDFPKVS
ncbi:hypothetical protein SteCoe_14957 [Stentor coeruleus]|uniref:Uncharacterized protein n=1 Tax=Stentor coeruleus TaxID=5963 RepID=A0A1R2C4X4_9CILI|nr:hypothetical protein SteCoe_14957 [Stentor coeruleus]